MAKTLEIFKHEIITLVSRFSFWFGAIGIPLIAFLIYSIAGGISQSSGGSEMLSGVLSEVMSQPEVQLPNGYVDTGGLLHDLPVFMQESDLVRYPDEEAALAALEAGEIDTYFVISPDYVESGEITSVSESFSINSIDSPDLIESALAYNLLSADMGRFERYQAPVNIQEISLATEPVRDEDNALTFFLPYGVTILFYIMIMGSATLLLNSVSKEKENRVIEMLMVSVTPRQLLTGKMLGLGLIGLFQVVVWGGTAFVLLRLSGNTFSLPPEFQLPTEILLWGLVYFVLGFMFYACLMAGLGALVPNIREASQASFVIVLPMMVPLFLISILIEDPNGTLAVVLSLVPMTSPVTMMLRLAAVTVPTWQLIASVLILVGAVFLAIRAAAGMFRAQTLLSGQEFKLKTFFLALAGRA